MRFSKEEISLCRQVAEKYWKPVKSGDWYCYTNYADENTLSIYLPGNQYEMPIYDRCVPIWAISDCISWLREKGFYLNINTLGEYWTCLAYKHIFNEKDENIGPRIFFQEKTPLEALLKAVLTVLEEPK